MSRYQLTDMQFDEVSLVDRGANQYAKTVIAKRDSGDGMEPEIIDEDGNALSLDDLEVGTVVVDDEGSEFVVEEDYDDEDGYFEADDDDDYEEVGKIAQARPLDPVARRLLRRGQQVVKPVADKIKVGATAVKAQAPGFAAGVGTATPIAYGAGRAAGINQESTRQAGIGLAERLGSKLGGQNAANWSEGQRRALGYGAAGATALTAAGVGYGAGKINKSYGGGSMSMREELEVELSKAMSDTERDEIISKAFGHIETLAQEVELAKALAAEEQELRVVGQYTEIAKSYSVGIDADVLGPVFKRIAENMDEEDQEIIKSVFDLASDLVEKAYFEEVGTSGTGHNSDVLSAVDEHLDSYLSKSDTTRSAEIVKLFEENPELYAQYEEERQYNLRHGI